MNQPLSVKKRSGFDTLLEWLLVGGVFLLPVLFLPALFLPFQFTKVLLIAIVALLGVAFFVVARMKDRALAFPKSPLLGALWLIPIVYLLSSVFSGNIGLSLFGRNIPTDSFTFIALVTLIGTLIVLGIRTKEGMFRLYMAFLASFVVVSLFQLLRLLFGPEFLAFGVLNSPTASVVGSWNDLAIFYGLTLILSLITLVGLTLEGAVKWILGGAIGVSLFFLVIINFSVVWWIVGGFALATFVYSLTAGSYGLEKKNTQISDTASQMRSLSGEGGTSFASLLVLAISLVFIVGGNFVGNITTSFLDVSQIEVRPSWQGTVDIARNTYAENAFFGSGPGTFAPQWLRYKPAEINQTPFWNIDFSSGFGFIPTSMVTTGAIGTVAWLLFLGLFLYAGFRALVARATDDPITYYLSLSSYLGALYLWIMLMVYTPNAVIIFFAFILTGVFLASVRRQPGGYFEKEISFQENPRLGFVTVLVLTLVFLGSIASVFAIGERYASAMYFQRALIALNLEGDIDRAEGFIAQAVSMQELDTYYQFGTNLNLIRLNQIVNDESLSEEEIRSRFQATLGAAIQNAQRAVALDIKNRDNWLTLAQVYQSVVPFEIEGAYESAKQAYEEARRLDPANPSIYLGLAQLAASREEMDEAREYITRSLERKNNYTPAIFLLAQIQIQEGDIDEAVRTVEATTIIEPQNESNFFQLGVLHYSNESFADAARALERALAINPQFANARYFLGLAQYEQGQVQNAILQFEEIEKTNQNNEDIKTILQNLRNGRAPLGEPSPAAREVVEDLDDLPLSDEE